MSGPNWKNRVRGRRAPLKPWGICMSGPNWKNRVRGRRALLKPSHQRPVAPIAKKRFNITALWSFVVVMTIFLALEGLVWIKNSSNNIEGSVVANSPLVWSGDTSDIFTSSARPMAKRTFILTNTANNTIPTLAQSFYTSENFVKITDTDCDRPLSPGSYCSISLEIQPSLEGEWTAQIRTKIDKNAVLILKGARRPPAGKLEIVATPAPGALDMASHGEETASVLIKNSGDLAQKVDPPNIDSKYFLIKNNCPAVLAPGGTCSFDVRLADQAPRGALKGVLKIGSLSVDLTANAQRANLYAYTNYRDKDLVVQISNSGDAIARLGQPKISGPNAEDFLILTNTCGDTLNPRAWCQITFLTPKNGHAMLEIGKYHQALDSKGAVLVWSMDGNFVIDSPKEKPAKTPPVHLTLKNEGNNPTALLDIKLNGPFEGDLDACKKILYIHQSCTVDVVGKAERDGEFQGSIGVVGEKEFVLKGIAKGMSAKLEWSGPKDWTDQARFELKNTSETVSENLADHVFIDGRDVKTSTTCVDVLTGGASCVVDLQRLGKELGILKIILKTDVDNKASFETQSTSGPAKIIFTPASLEGSVSNDVYHQASFSLSIRNNGGESLPFEPRFQGSGSAQLSVGGSDCGESIDPGAACTVSINASTTQKEGIIANFVVSPTQPSVSILVHANLTPRLSVLTPAMPLNITNNDSKQISFTVQNLGGLASAPFGRNDLKIPEGMGDSQGTCYGVSINPGEQCKIDFTFASQFSGNVNITLGGSGGLPQFKVYGNVGHYLPKAVWQESHTSGLVGLGSIGTARLLNNGPGALILNLPNKIDGFELDTTTCKDILNAGQNCQINYRLTQPGDWHTVLSLPDIPDLTFEGTYCQDTTPLVLPGQIRAPAGCHTLSIDGVQGQLLLDAHQPIWVGVKNGTIVQMNGPGEGSKSIYVPLWH